MDFNKLISNDWVIPTITDFDNIPTGDMPFDSIQINDKHVEKAKVIFKNLLELLRSQINDNRVDNSNKIVISVFGGSGVGKSEVGSLLSYFFNCLGVTSYILSGDNYPRRIPSLNDNERLRVYRLFGVQALVKNNLYNDKVKQELLTLCEEYMDCDISLVEKYSWLSKYQRGGSIALEKYLGTDLEINFDEINNIISHFKRGQESIYLKRMGRAENQLWYDEVDFSTTNILIIEWTHGNNSNLNGVDYSIMLNSTPEETLAHRLTRNRDGNTDSPFISLVLSLEQKKLNERAKTASIIITKDCKIISYSEFKSLMGLNNINNGPMLNSYPDSIGEKLSDTIKVINKQELSNCFESFYILPSIFNTDIDRGFSVIDYSINDVLASRCDLETIKEAGIDLKLDFILNHASVLSKQFQDIIKNGENSKYVDFFINWNKFWQGYGEINEEGILVPQDKYIKDMFFRKPGLPILNVRMPDGKEVPYWNTFYQQISYDKVDIQDIITDLDIQYEKASRIVKIINDNLDINVVPKDMNFGQFDCYKERIVDILESRRKYLGQMDLNIESPLVWDFYEDTLKQLSNYGAKIVRLDAFAYAPKAPGKKNFLNDPETWQFLDKVKTLSDKYNITLLPEIHSKYEDKIHTKIAKMGYLTYDFFLPGLLIDAIERKSSLILKKWIDEIINEDIKTVNMLGSHDGIPLLDLKGLLNDNQIQNLIDTVVSRGGYVKDLHGKKNMYYQVNATYFSALGEKQESLLLARALQMFMPGKPQIWYLDLFAGKNDYDAVVKAGAGGHKEINRTNLTIDQIDNILDTSIVKKQLELIRFRKTHKAFNSEAIIAVEASNNHSLKISWKYEKSSAILNVDFESCSYSIDHS